ncbi:MAG TPA: hypothetical protein VFS00_03270, partial [Polyangiaceae bacterium]|nr:hypothetical protein [Polyangiaceae bacterium]
MRRLSSLLATLATLAFASPGLADDDPPKRPLPDYDRRPPPATTLGEGLLWGPRVVFAPLYLVLDYGLR